MQTRRDHLQAYQFGVGRLATALVTGDPGRGTSPTRRGTLGTVFGVILMVLLCAGFGIFGLLKPVQKGPGPLAGSIIVEKETGTRYLMVNGGLRPVLNYTSALLLTQSSAAVRTVSRTDLDKLPHGPMVGIPGAPDSLPAPAAVLSGGWARCLRPGLPTGELLDLAPGRPVAVPADQQVVLAAGDARFVLWRGVKYPVPDPSVLIALGLDVGTPLAAPLGWLGSVPTGTTLSASAVPDNGSPAGDIAGHAVRVGQVLRADASGGRSYVMLRDGIAPVGATEAALLAARKGAAPTLTLAPSTLAGMPLSATGLPAARLPELLGAPRLETTKTALCLRQTPTDAKLTTTVVLESGPAATAGRTVRIAPGHGLLVINQDQLRSGNNNPQKYLVTDQGTVFPFGDANAPSQLRLSGPATPMPAAVLALLPRGPVLDRAAATATLRTS